MVGFSDRIYPKANRVIAFGPSSCPEIVMGNLYYILRLLDQEEVEAAWVDMDFPRSGLWLTIEERLKKAATR